MIRCMTWWLLAGLILCGTPPALLALSTPPAGHPSGLATVSTPDGFTIYCEIADTPASRSRGLMYRKNMAPDRGMLFLFSEADYWTFWMKNTRMPLDILWLDQNGKIVHLADHVPICNNRQPLPPLPSRNGGDAGSGTSRGTSRRAQTHHGHTAHNRDAEVGLSCPLPVAHTSGDNDPVHSPNSIERSFEVQGIGNLNHEVEDRLLIFPGHNFRSADVGL